MVREAIADLRRAAGADEDPYRHVDLATATRLGGALYLLGFVVAVVSLPLSPPSGPLGVPGVLACLAPAVAMGVGLIRRREPAHPNVLLAGVYVGLVAAIVLRASAGAGAPFTQLLFIGTMYACAVHPVRRTLLVLFCASAAALTPTWYEPVGADFAAAAVSQLLLTWAVGLLVLGWMTRVRRGRAASHALARADTLTGLHNRRALEEALPAAVAAARRHGHPLSILVADLDGLKAINDVHGHQAGDDLLRSAARSMSAALRVCDPCFRWGGDEFVALLLHADVEEAREIAARVQSTVALSCRTPDGRPVRVTVEAAELAEGETGADTFLRADEALLEAKRRRRPPRARAG